MITTNELITVRMTLYELLQCRGIQSSSMNIKLSPDAIDILTQELNSTINTTQADIFVVDPITKKRIYIRFYNSDIDPIDMSNEYKRLSASHFLNSTYDDFIFVLLNDISDIPVETVRYLEHLYENVNVFYYKELLYNITKHNLVPKCELLSDPLEKSELKKTLMLKSFKQLPAQHRSDPVSRFYGFRTNDVIKVYRRSACNRIAIVYKIIIDPEFVLPLK